MENQPFVFSQLKREQQPPLSSAVAPRPAKPVFSLSSVPSMRVPITSCDSDYLFHQAKDMDAGAPRQGGNSTLTGTSSGGAKHSKAGKKQRYAFQTRSKVDVLDDGYRWRKYGQKAVKNTKFPRSYYRCTHPGCGVKKQVQRLSKDEEVVITTYDGVHNHPIQRPNDSFDHILREMQIFNGYIPTQMVPYG